VEIFSTKCTPDPTLEAQVRAVAVLVPGVLGLDKCYVRKMGFSYYVNLHVIVDGKKSVRDGHHIAHLVEDEVLASLPQISEVLVHIEPEEELTRKRGYRFLGAQAGKPFIDSGIGTCHQQ
jgi:divalent metal cation (Fe/Co/Zn/Cd) transporter